jgi:hypothetical protein
MSCLSASLRFCTHARTHEHVRENAQRRTDTPAMLAEAARHPHLNGVPVDLHRRKERLELRIVLLATHGLEEPLTVAQNSIDMRLVCLGELQCSTLSGDTRAETSQHRHVAEYGRQVTTQRQSGTRTGPIETG